MAIPVITEGATTTHGGNITECVPTFRIHGKGVHADGMSHYCPKCSATVQAIAFNHTKSIHGKAVVLEGDKTTCGASFIASQNVAFIDGGGNEKTAFGSDGLLVQGSDDYNFDSGGLGNSLASRQSLYVDLKGDKDAVYDGGLDGSKFSISGKGSEEAFRKIKSTKQGKEIINAIQNDSKIYRVDINQSESGALGLTTQRNRLTVLTRNEPWEFWKSTEYVDKVDLVTNINMSNEDSHLVRSGSKYEGGVYTNVFRPDLTRVIAHELGHMKNYVDTGNLNDKHKAITYENIIMRQLDKNSIVRHPSAEHGGM